MSDAVGLELGSFLKYLRIGFEGDQSAGAFGLADDLQLLGRLAALELHVINLAIAGNFDRKPFGNGVDAFGADPVCAAGIGITALAIFAAGMQSRQHQFDAGNFILGMNVHRNAAAIVADGNRAINMDRDIDAIAVLGEIFIH